MRLATDLSILPDGVPPIPLLRPLLAERSPTGSTSWERRYEPWELAGSSYHQLVDLEAAEVVVIPFDWYWVRGTSWASRPNRALARAAGALNNRAREAGKPVAVFFGGDRSCDRVGLIGAHVFREGAYRSRLGVLDHPLPAFSEDLLAAFTEGRLLERTYHQRPTVGFCGLAANGGIGPGVLAKGVAHQISVLARERRTEPSPKTGERLRSRTMQLLEQSPLVDTDFVVRSNSVFFRDGDASDLVDVRQAYVNNLLGSDYVLCIRGSGNYSYRLYEAMSVGRIPVIVDTDLALPRPESVPWPDLAVWVPAKNVDAIAEYVHQFHQSLDPASFTELQYRLRQSWVDHLSVEGFLAHWPNVALSSG